MAQADKVFSVSLDESSPLIEPIPIGDTFATGVDVGYFPDFVRLIYWVEQPMELGTNRLIAPLERQIVGKIVMPRESFERAVTRFLWQRAQRIRQSC